MSDYEPEDKRFTADEMRRIRDAFEYGLHAADDNELEWMTAPAHPIHYNCPCILTPVMREIIAYHDPYPEPSE